MLQPKHKSFSEALNASILKPKEVKSSKPGVLETDYKPTQVLNSTLRDAVLVEFHKQGIMEKNRRRNIVISGRQPVHSVEDTDLSAFVETILDILHQFLRHDGLVQLCPIRYNHF